MTVWGMPDSVILKDGAAACRAGAVLDSGIIRQVVEALLDPSTPDDDRAYFLISLTDRGETAEELAAFAQALLVHAEPLEFTHEWNGRPIVDSCGTGGGGVNLVNVSTGILFILAALGVPIVKHGNRGVTKKSGSADVLEALGLRMDVGADGVRRTMEEIGVAFIFAPRFHPAFKTIAPVRKKLAAEGRRTVFNLLGPLLNPARPRVHLLGVFQEAHLSLFAETLARLNRSEWGSLVVYGKDENGNPIGEVSPCGSTFLEPDNGSGKTEFQLRQVPVDCRVSSLEGAYVSSAAESAQFIQMALSGEAPKPVEALLLLNAAFVLMLTHIEMDGTAAVQRCEDVLRSGAALEKLRQWRKLSVRL